MKDCSFTPPSIPAPTVPSVIDPDPLDNLPPIQITIPILSGGGGGGGGGINLGGGGVGEGERAPTIEEIICIITAIETRILASGVTLSYLWQDAFIITGYSFAAVSAFFDLIDQTKFIQEGAPGGTGGDYPNPIGFFGAGVFQPTSWGEMVDALKAMKFYINQSTTESDHTVVNDPAYNPATQGLNFSYIDDILGPGNGAARNYFLLTKIQEVEKSATYRGGSFSNTADPYTVSYLSRTGLNTFGLTVENVGLNNITPGLTPNIDLYAIGWNTQPRLLAQPNVFPTIANAVYNAIYGSLPSTGYGFQFLTRVAGYQMVYYIDAVYGANSGNGIIYTNFVAGSVPVLTLFVYGLPANTSVTVYIPWSVYKSVDTGLVGTCTGQGSYFSKTETTYGGTVVVSGTTNGSGVLSFPTATALSQMQSFPLLMTDYEALPRICNHIGESVTLDLSIASAKWLPTGSVPTTPKILKVKYKASQSISDCVYGLDLQQP